MNLASEPAKTISPDQLVCMDEYIWEHPLAVKLAYMQSDNALFGQQIYRTGAKLWLYRDLAKIIMRAARSVFNETGGTLVLFDGLRVTNAQEAMLETPKVKANPQWLQEPRLLSPPGTGGHPRGMAVDVSIMGSDGALFDMGTEFDDLSEKSHREYSHSDCVKANRAILDGAMMGAAEAVGVPLLPLPQEWWDYRLLPETYEQYAPLSDEDLPEHMRLMD